MMHEASIEAQKLAACDMACACDAMFLPINGIEQAPNHLAYCTFWNTCILYSASDIALYLCHV